MVSCTDSYGDPGVETDSCTQSCQWGAGVCVVCTAGATQSCVDGCDLCTGGCIPGHQTCLSNGTWGRCIGSRCTCLKGAC
jgi:hypothetical protein